jgi:hypothetical protein
MCQKAPHKKKNGTPERAVLLCAYLQPDVTKFYSASQTILESLGALGG